MLQSDYITRVELEISDPWDFGTAHGTGPFQGRLVKLFASKIYKADKLGVVKLDTVLDFKAMRYEYLLVQTRHADVRIIEIQDGKKIFCNLSAISEKSANASDPLVASQNDPCAPVLIGNVTCKKKE